MTYTHSNNSFVLVFLLLLQFRRRRRRRSVRGRAADLQLRRVAVGALWVHPARHDGCVVRWRATTPMLHVYDGWLTCYVPRRQEGRRRRPIADLS